MTDLLFIKPIEKKNVSKPVWKGIDRVSFTRPAIAQEVDPVQTEEIHQNERQTRSSFTIGTIVIILCGEYEARRGVVIADKGAGILTIAGIDFPAQEIDQDYLIATETKLEIGNVDVANASAAIEAAAQKIDQMVEFLRVPFTLKKGDRPHLMRF